MTVEVHSHVRERKETTTRGLRVGRRGREREGKKGGSVCVCEREREREKMRKREYERKNERGQRADVMRFASSVMREIALENCP